MGQGTAGQGRVGQGRVGHGKRRVGQVRTGRCKVGQGRVGNVRAGNGRVGQGRVWHGMARQVPGKSSVLFFKERRMIPRFPRNLCALFFKKSWLRSRCRSLHFPRSYPPFLGITVNSIENEILVLPRGQGPTGLRPGHCITGQATAGPGRGGQGGQGVGRRQPQTETREASFNCISVQSWVESFKTFTEMKAVVYSKFQAYSSVSSGKQFREKISVTGESTDA